MTKKMSKQLIEEAIQQPSIAHVYMKYNADYYLVPLAASSKLFLAILEDDFAFDGYRISRFRDIKKIQIKQDKYNDIIRAEGLFDTLEIPEIGLDSWQKVFDGLEKIGRNIIVEYETPEGEDDTLTIGQIAEVYGSCVYIYHFDADGIWMDAPDRIPYNLVTSVTFDNRYVNVFSRHIPEQPLPRKQ